MTSDPVFKRYVEEFPWQSEAQRKGYLALVQYMRGFGIEPTLPIDPQVCWQIQKDHESHEWWVEVLGNQVGALQAEIIAVRRQISDQAREIEALRHEIHVLRQSTSALAAK